MFDVGFSEMVLIAILVLLVFGPDKLPELGRKLGDFFRAFQQSKRDIHTSLFSPPTSSTQQPIASDKTPSNDNDTKQSL